MGFRGTLKGPTLCQSTHQSFSFLWEMAQIGQESRKKISKKKKDTTPNFLHRGPKKGVETEYDIYFGQILANKIRNVFFVVKTAIFALKTVFLLLLP